MDMLGDGEHNTQIVLTKAKFEASTAAK